MTKLKILILSHYFYPSIGGIELISKILAEAFVEAGHEVLLLTWSEDPNKTVFRFEVTRNPGMTEMIKAHSWADLVFENNICIRLGWPRVFFGKPAVIGLQTWLSSTDDRPNFRWKLKRRWLKGAKKVIACSAMIKDNCWPNASVIRNPYQENIFKLMPEIPRNLDFVFLGRLVSDKGADLAVQAFKKVVDKSERADLSLTIIGDGPEMENLKSMVSDLALEPLVTFEGALQGNKLARCLNMHKSLLVPSRWKEPFGIVALEGMACGCIPIVSDGGGLPFAIGKAGLTFSRNEPNDLADKMNAVLVDPYLNENIKKEIASHIEIHNSKEIAAQYLSLIESSVRKG